MANSNVVQFPTNSNTSLPATPVKRARGRPGKLPPGVVAFTNRAKYHPATFAVGDIVRVRAPADERNIGMLARVTDSFSDGCNITGIGAMFHVWKGKGVSCIYTGLAHECFLSIDSLILVENSAEIRAATN